MIAREDTEEALGLGNLIWLASPLLVSILIRLFTKDWKDIGIKLNFKSNGKWYLFSIFSFPVIIGVVVLAGSSIGKVTFSNFKTGLFLQALALAFFGMFIKNIFEEFAWRGYLTPRVNSVMPNSILGHLIVGFIWGTWHLPYYLGLLDQASLAKYTSLPSLIFLPMIILGMTLAGILFGEIRLITGSTWPAVLMHTMSNIVVLTLLVDSFIEISDQTEILFTPSWEGILTMILITLAGLWVYRERTSGR